MAHDATTFEHECSLDTTTDAEAAVLIRAEIARQEVRRETGDRWARMGATAEIEYLTRALADIEAGVPSRHLPPSAIIDPRLRR